MLAAILATFAAALATILTVLAAFAFAISPVRMAILAIAAAFTIADNGRDDKVSDEHPTLNRSGDKSL